MIWVIKVGGALLDSESALQNIFNELASHINQGTQVVLVHGGGTTVDTHLYRAGFTSKKHNGLRISPIEQMPIITGALAGTVNKQLVCAATKSHICAVGLSLADGNLSTCVIRQPELGQVADAIGAEPAVLKQLLSINILPIVSSIGQDEHSQLVNINADDAAAAIAEMLSAELIFLSDVPGVLDETQTLIDELSVDHADELIDSGVIHGGMAVKVKAALATANRLGRSIAVTSWQQPASIGAIIQGQRAGTRILPGTKG